MAEGRHARGATAVTKGDTADRATIGATIRATAHVIDRQ